MRKQPTDIINVLLLIILFALTGCGGNANSKDTDKDQTVLPPSTPATIVLGEFIDEPVEGLIYICSSGLSGLTDEDGKYACQVDDNVTFTIGTVTIGTVPTQTAMITPYTMFPDDHDAAINLARLLQSVDQDSDVSNGITIDKSLVASLPANTDFSVTSFEAVIQNSLAVSLIGASEAQQHLNAAIINAGGIISSNDDSLFANAGHDRYISIATEVTLNGADSYNRAKLIPSYRWEFLEIPMGSDARLSDPTLINPHFFADVEGLYVVRLTIGPDNNSATDTVTITATKGNKVPFANAGVDQFVSTTSYITLDGSDSHDMDDEINYQWTILSKPENSNATLSGHTEQNSTFVADLDGIYEIQLTLNDGVTHSDSDRVIVTATSPRAENSAPVVDALIYRHQDDKAFFVGDHIFLTAEADDSDGDDLAYHWTITEKPQASTAHPTFTSNGHSPNGDFYPDIPGTYSIEVQAYDGNLLSDPSSMTIIVKEIPGTKQWRTAELIETRSGDAHYPEISVNPKGDAMVVWQQKEGAFYDIVANHHVAGRGWQSTDLLENYTESSHFPQTVLDKDNNAIAVWQQDDGKIWSNHYSDGADWDVAEVIKLDGDVGSNDSPQISMDIHGNAILVWKHNGLWEDIIENGELPGGILSARYSLDEGWSKIDYIYTSKRYDYAYTPLLDLSDTGRAMVVWGAANEGDLSIEGMHYSEDSEWESIRFTNILRDIQPSLSMNTYGNAAVSWTTLDSDAIWVQQYRDRRGWSEPEQVTDIFGTSEIAMGDNGAFTIIWNSNDSTIYARRYTDRWEQQVEIGEGDYHQVVVDADGNTIVVWTKDGDVFVRRHIVDLGWQTAVVIDDMDGEASTPKVGVDANGNAIVVWSQFDGTYYSIYANQFN